MTTDTTEVHRPTEEHLREAKESGYVAFATGPLTPVVILLGKLLARASTGRVDGTFSEVAGEAVISTVVGLLLGGVAFLFRGQSEIESLKSLRFYVKDGKLIKEAHELRTELDLLTVTKITLSQDYAGQISSLILHTSDKQAVGLGGLERIDTLYQKIKRSLPSDVVFDYTMPDVPLLGAYMRVVIIFVFGIAFSYLCYLYFD